MNLQQLTGTPFLIYAATLGIAALVAVLDLVLRREIGAAEWGMVFFGTLLAALIAFFIPPLYLVAAVLVPIALGLLAWRLSDKSLMPLTAWFVVQTAITLFWPAFALYSRAFSVNAVMGVQLTNNIIALLLLVVSWIVFGLDSLLERNFITPVAAVVVVVSFPIAHTLLRDMQAVNDPEFLTLFAFGASLMLALFGYILHLAFRRGEHESEHARALDFDKVARATGFMLAFLAGIQIVLLYAPPR